MQTLARINDGYYDSWWHLKIVATSDQPDFANCQIQCLLTELRFFVLYGMNLYLYGTKYAPPIGYMTCCI